MPDSAISPGMGNGGGGGPHPDLSAHDALGLVLDAELATHAALSHGKGKRSLTIAGSNLSAAEKASADFVCDGVADEAEWALAQAAGNSIGVLIAGIPGSVFNTTGIIETTANRREILDFTGTRINPAADITALGIGQAVGGDAMGALILNPYIEPTVLNGQTGLRVRDSDRGMIKGARVKGVSVGLAMESIAVGEWNEATVVEDTILTDCTIGLDAVKTLGDGSFGETHVRNLAINNCTSAIRMGSGTNFYRSVFSGVTVWMHVNQTGWYINGNITGLQGHFGFENLDTPTSTGVVGIALGPDAIGALDADIHINWSGTFASKVSDPNGKFFGWREGRRDLVNNVNAGALGDWRTPADVEPRVVMTGWNAGGGGIGFGNGGGILFWLLAERNNVARVTGAFEMDEIADPGAPAADRGMVYARDNGSGKTQVVARFATSEAVLATQDSAALSLLAAWPVGAVYTSVVSTSPATLFGGTWAAFGAGRVLVGLDAGDVDFDTAEEVGGAKTVALSVANLPAHDHTIPVGATDDTSAPFDRADAGTNAAGANATTLTGQTGSGTAHNNVQPYIVVYMWKRTA